MGVHHGLGYSLEFDDFLERSSPATNIYSKVHKAINKGDKFYLNSNWWWEIEDLVEEGNEFQSICLDPRDFHSQGFGLRTESAQGVHKDFQRFYKD